MLLKCSGQTRANIKNESCSGWQTKQASPRKGQSTTNSKNEGCQNVKAQQALSRRGPRANFENECCENVKAQQALSRVGQINNKLQKRMLPSHLHLPNKQDTLRTDTTATYQCRRITNLHYQSAPSVNSAKNDYQTNEPKDSKKTNTAVFAHGHEPPVSAVSNGLLVCLLLPTVFIIVFVVDLVLDFVVTVVRGRKWVA